MSKLKLAVLISGSGTNLQSLIDCIAEGTLNAEIAIVISSRADAYGLVRAEQAGIQTMTIDRELYKRESGLVADAAIASTCKQLDVDYIVMAGYMRMVRLPILSAFPNRVVNLHPALLPSFQGAHAIQDAYDRGVKITGVTVHFANEVYDQGPIIAQRALEVEEGWDIDELEAHIHEIEHELYPEVIQLLAEGRVLVRDNNTVEIKPKQGI